MENQFIIKATDKELIKYYGTKDRYKLTKRVKELTDSDIVELYSWTKSSSVSITTQNVVENVIRFDCFIFT